MARYLNNVSVFTGEHITNNDYLERRIKGELEAFGEYAARRFDTIHFGCGHEGRAKIFREAVAREGGNLVDVRPEFYTTQNRWARLSFLKACLDMDRNMKEGALEYVDAMLDFKRNFLVPGGLRVVFPGGPGVRSEKAVCEEEGDTLRRVSSGGVLVPMIAFNIERENGRGFYDADIEHIEAGIADNPYLSGRRNLCRYVSTVVDAVTLIDAYEALGPVKGRDLERFVPVVGGEPARDLWFREVERPRVVASEYRCEFV